MCDLCICHSAFHYLTHPHGVLIPHDSPTWEETYVETRPLLIHLTVTGRCYARCVGCVNASVTLGLDVDRNQLLTASETVPERDAQAVINLVSRSPGHDAVLCFYGGEPLLAADKIARVVELIDHSTVRRRVRYMLITNGELLVKAMARRPRLLERLWLTGVSIDGAAAQHNLFRRGTDLANIHTNLEALKSVRRGDVLMWSTLREGQSLFDCFLEFQEARTNGWLEHFFWHWAEGHTPMTDLPAYLEEYAADLRRVMAVYREHLARGQILSLIHINELILYLITGKSRGATACGVELATNYDIAGGRIHACADLPPELALGAIAPDGSFDLDRPDLSHLIAYKDPLGCYTCGVHAYCGGRCPVQAAAGPEILAQYCALMRLHVEVVQDYLPDIASLLKKHDISLQTLYNESAYLTQFTDVTP
jgi:radical SAM protein with 4Fe4S-binding SPASM domain